MVDEETEETIGDLLKSVDTVAVVGCSRDPSKDAHKVPAFLQSVGYTVIPVNPNAEEILDEECYDDLLEFSANDDREVDLVDVFRPSVEAPGILDDVLEIGLDTVWLQQGLRHDRARDRAREEDVRWIQDRCMLAEYRKRFDTTPKDEI